jgi:hypothetical protein
LTVTGGVGERKMNKDSKSTEELREQLLEVHTRIRSLKTTIERVRVADGPTEHLVKALLDNIKVEEAILNELLLKV